MCKVKIMCKMVIYKGSKINLFCGQEMRSYLVVKLQCKGIPRKEYVHSWLDY